MEELIIETPDTESSEDGMDALPESTDPDTEVTLSEPEENPGKTEQPFSTPETVSGNSADYSYGSGADSSTDAAYESGGTDSLLLVETLERQNDILCAGFMSTLFILGTILGVLVMHGFRLRRV